MYKINTTEIGKIPAGLPAGRLSILPLLLMVALIVPPQSRAAEYNLSGTFSWFNNGANQNRNVANGDIYFVDATPGSQMSSFLVPQPDKDFWLWGLVPNWPTPNDYQLAYKAYFYRYAPDRPSWLAAQIDTWSTPVEVMAPASSGTTALEPPKFTLTGNANTFSLVSSDAYADGKRRMDTNNINWSILHFNDVYTNQPIIYINAITPNDITLDLEHVIFMGSMKTQSSYATGNGSSVIQFNGGASKTLTINGDVGFVNNMGNAGGVINGNGNITFTGNVFFDGNIAGIVTANAQSLRDENGLLYDPEHPEDFPKVTFLHTQSSCGVIRLTASNLTLTFERTTLFTNNISCGEAGAVMLGNGSNNSMVFGGNVAFFGNIAGMTGKYSGGGGGVSNEQGPGRGGAIYWMEASGNQATNTATFRKEAIFVSNRSNDGGGAIGNLQTRGVNANFIFEDRAIFLDNFTGREDRYELIELVSTEDLADYLGTMAPMPNYYGNGGAIATTGGNGSTLDRQSALLFKGESQFARNLARGSGGAISYLPSSSSTGGSIMNPVNSYHVVEFTSDATFTNNAAGSTLMRYGTGTTAASPGLPISPSNSCIASGDAISKGGAIATAVKTYFGGTTGGQLLAEGNFVYFTATSATTVADAWSLVSGNGGVIYSAGTAAGLYIDQKYNFLRNQAGGNGGAIYAIGTIKGLDYQGSKRDYAVELTKTGNFVENLALGNGGAIFATSALVTSGASFENNFAGGDGGAILMYDNGLHLKLDAVTDDITFTGNRHGVDVDVSGIDFGLITSETATGGYMTADAASGQKNDITFRLLPSQSGTLELNAGAGFKIYFDGGLTMSSTSTTDAGTLHVTKTGAGTVEFDGADANINAVSDVQAGTLLIRDGYYGHSGADAKSAFTLGSAATLAANGSVRARTITINDGATLRVLEGGSLAFDSANAINYGATINLAGNGTILTGATKPLTAASIDVGDTGRTQAQTLTLNKNAGTRLDVVLNGSQISLGLFAGGSDLVRLGSLDLGTATNRVNLTSLASGNFTLITADTNITNTTTAFELYYKGALLPNNARLTSSIAVNGHNVNLDYNAQNTTVTWTGASDDNWNATDAKWTGAGVTDGKYLYGDIIHFDATKSGNVNITTDAAASGMTVSNDYTLTGAGGIELNKLLWSGAAENAANGILVKDGGAGTTLTLANATGAGAANQFAGIDIKSGIVSVGNAAQLGTALSNITFSGAASDNATLRITDTLALSGKNGSQRLAIADGNTGNFVVDPTGVLAVVGNKSEANGGVLHIGAGSTLNLSAAGDIIFSGNTAASGGAAHLETGATFNIDVAEGKTVLFGNPNPKATHLDPRLLQADTLASADDTAIINKNGAGSFLINGDSSDYKGHLNINAGTVWMNSDAILGGNVTLNGAGSTFAATTLLGNITANAGTRLQVGDLGSNVPQTLRVGGTLALNNAALVLDGFQGSLIYRDLYTDFVETEAFNMTGTNSLDVNFAKLSSGIYKILTVTSGSFLDAAGEYTIPVNTVVKDAWSATNAYTGTASTIGDDPDILATGTLDIVVNGTTYQHIVKDLLLTSEGVSIEGKRFTASVYLETLSSGTTLYSVSETGTTSITGTVAVSGSSLAGSGTIDATIVSGTLSDTHPPTDTLYLDVAVQNYRLLWTGSTSAAWNATDADWSEPMVNADNRFLGGDGVHFDSISDAGNEASRTIAVTQGGVLVGEMIVSGTANYTFTGGSIEGASFRSNLEDPDLASGSLEMNGTGILTLANAGNKFNKGIHINSGTVVGNAASLNENNITVAAATSLVYVQGVNDTFIGAVSGSGSVVKTGTGRLTFSTAGNASMAVGSLLIAEGSIAITSTTAQLSVTNDLIIAAAGGLISSNTISAGVLIHAGTLARTTGTTSTTSYIPLAGDYIAIPGSKLVLNMLSDSIGVDSLFIDGNATGETEVVLRPSGTYANLSKPPVKRDMILIRADGINQLRVTNPLGEPFTLTFQSGTSAFEHEYKLIQGRTGTVYLRNGEAPLTPVNLPTAGAIPLIADMLGQEVTNAFIERINARHEEVSKGWAVWTNFAHSTGHLRGGWYQQTDLKTNVSQLGAEYTFSDAGASGAGQLGIALSYAYASANAKRRDNQSTIDADTHSVNASATWRKGPVHASLIGSYSPPANYKVSVAPDEDLFYNSKAKGERLSALLEIGGIITVPKGGQFEPYIQASWQHNSFDGISRSRQDIVRPDADAYEFDDFTKLRGFAGARWSARYDTSPRFALKPWLGYGAGYALKDSYRLRLDNQYAKLDLNGTYNKFSGGFSALWAFGMEAYATCQWTTGANANNLTLLGGINYRW